MFVVFYGLFLLSVVIRKWVDVGSGGLWKYWELCVKSYVIEI